MDTFLDRIAKLPHKKLALLAAELYQRSLSTSGPAEPIAITAMACRFPGSSDTPGAFWSFLDRGGDAIEPIPDTRLAMTDTPRADMSGKGANWGAFLPRVDEFDPMVFGISAREAASMDPQQRLLLEVCWEALENVGTPVDALDNETGVFMGVSGFDYAMLSHGSGREQNGYMVTGVANAVVAGRISYVFGFNGPSTVVDTACSASASAIHLACQSLRAHECEQALAGGINLLLLPQITQTIAGLEGLASDGRCKAFSAGADGFGRGEGCGVIVLRRLSEAQARREPILGLIRGSAWNQDGKSGGLTAPNGAAQERVIRAALAAAKLQPDQVSYLEAHGTGTALGDPIEIAAIGRVFGTEARHAKPIIVGSVKTNIGHLEAAAGVAGVIKVLLALRHERIPAHLHAETLNPQVNWSGLPVHIPLRNEAWPLGAVPRVAGVSSFGLSGTNVHLVIAEPPILLDADRAKTEPMHGRPATLLTLSAKSHDALLALAGRYAEALTQRPDVDIAAFAASANQKRAHFAHRLALPVTNPTDAADQLERFSRGDAGSRVRSAFVVQHRPPQIGWMFDDTQPDAAWVAALSAAEPVFQTAYDSWLSAIGSSAIGTATNLALVPASIGFQFALAELWRSWGIRPALAVSDGSAAGRIAAALAAGGLRLADAAQLAVRNKAAQIPTYPLSLKLLTSSLPDALMPGQVLPPDFPIPGASATADPDARPALAERAHQIVDRLVEIPATDANALLSDLATVYLAGAPVDWKAFHQADADDVGPLPNYPFQRTRYWPAGLAGMRQRIAAPELSQSELDEGIYRVEWRTLEQPLLRSTPAPSEVIEVLRPRLFKIEAEQDFEDVHTAQRALDDFAISAISAALFQLRPTIARGTVLPAENLTAALGVIPAQDRMVRRMFAILEANALAEHQGDRWVITGDLPRADLVAEIERLRWTYPTIAVEINIAARAGLLADVLRGKISGVDVLFPNGSFALLDALYRDSMAGRLMNRLFGETVAGLVRLADGPLRILEIGAGTGSTTAAVLPHLPPATDYTFTDVSPAFLPPARAAFASRSISFDVLDIESATDVQAQAIRPFDLVLAANVLHATRDLRQTLDHVRSLLRPGGALVLLEGTETLAITDITLGMLEGWWKHNKADSRSSGPLLSQGRWRTILDEAGFDVACLPEDPSFGGVTKQQTIVVARMRLALPVLAPVFPNQGEHTRSVIILHRNASAASAARTALEAAGLTVHDSPMPGDAWLPALPETVPAQGRDTMWLYLAPYSVNEDPLGDTTTAASDLLSIAQAVQHVSGATPSLCLATAGAQPTNTSIRPAHAALWGIGRVLASEAPGIRVSLVDLDSEKPDWDRLAHVIASGTELPESAISMGRTLTPMLAPVHLAEPLQQAFASSDASYIVTGAFGVLGGYATSWLAEQGAGKLFLVGRNPPGTQSLATIEAARNGGAEIELVIADISTSDGVEALFTRLEADSRPLKGIIHSAASVDDALIIRQTPASFARTFGPKAAGAWLLHERSRRHQLDFFVLYSSIAALIGPAGQSNYAAANCFIDALAHHRRAVGLPAVSLNWGLWSSTGAAVRRDVIETGVMQGAIPITPDQGHAVLARAMASAEPQVALMPLDWAVLRQALGVHRAPTLLSAKLSGLAEAPGFAPPSNSVTRYAQQLVTASGPEKAGLLVDFIRQRSADLLNFDLSTSIPDDRPLLELGLDSLVGLELKNDLQTLSGLEIPSTLFFDCPTINDLAQYLRLALPPKQSADSAAPVSELEQVFI